MKPFFDFPQDPRFFPENPGRWPKRLWKVLWIMWISFVDSFGRHDYGKPQVMPVSRAKVRETAEIRLPPRPQKMGLTPGEKYAIIYFAMMH